MSGSGSAPPAVPPRVSVVMAVFNGERHLQESVGSILEQSFRDWELVLVDDGSMDATVRIVESFGDSRIHLFRNERNLGQTPSLNRGLRLARGEFIARQDADDVSEPERLARQVSFLESQPEVALLGTQYTEIDDAGVARPGIALPCADVDLCWHMQFNTAFIHSSVMFRRDRVLAQAGLYDETLVYAQDYEYWLRIAAASRVANLDLPLVRYRVHDASMSARFMGTTSNEMPHLRTVRHAVRLGWEGVPSAEHRERSESMAALMLGWGDSLHVDLLERAADDLLRLHDAFCRERQLPRDRATEHREKIRSGLARNLALIAAARTLKHPGEAGRLWRRALVLHPASALHWRMLAKYAGRTAASVGLRLNLLDHRRSNL